MTFYLNLFRSSTENTNAKGNSQTEPNKHYDQVSILSPEHLQFFISLVYHLTILVLYKKQKFYEPRKKDCKTLSTIGFLFLCVCRCAAQLCSYNVLIMTWCLDVRLFSLLSSVFWTNLNLGRFYLTFWGHLFRSYQIMSRTRLANENQNRVKLLVYSLLNGSKAGFVSQVVSCKNHHVWNYTNGLLAKAKI